MTQSELSITVKIPSNNIGSEIRLNYSRNLSKKLSKSKKFKRTELAKTETKSKVLLKILNFSGNSAAGFLGSSRGLVDKGVGLVRKFRV